uniref:Complement component 6 n=1 Tax=Sphaeramia orbicularis TaxID=375764 RepID=A0A673AQZ3_9TELE
MSPSGRLVLLVQLLTWTSAGLACFCERYPWGPWSICSKTCNHGTQTRTRIFRYDDGYFWSKSCHQLCDRTDTRACNQQACPINCQLTPFSAWSDCSPCARKQFRTSSVQRPSQFEGASCNEDLTEERPCHPSTECRLPPVDCKDDFQCDNGRCIDSTLTCNRQNDCLDNSDERDCTEYKTVCPTERRVAPGVDLVGNGFDAVAEEPRGAVLDNMFMGGECIIRRPPSLLLYHRVAHNFNTFNITVRKRGGGECFKIAFLVSFFSSGSLQDSQFFRVHQVLPVSTFSVKDPVDLVLSGPFLQFLQALPLQYDYALYRDVFRLFGTHYYSSGTLGGHYDLLYQYSREELRSSGTTFNTVTHSAGKSDKSLRNYSFISCTVNKTHSLYFLKSFSMVRGGRTREAAALAWERQGPAPDRTSYRNWAKSVIENPAVVDYKLLPIVDLVRRIPCAVTKRRHLKRALQQYLEEFDTCKCAPCPNNARPVLSGTECKCICQTGTFGANCERRAPDFTSEQVDGSWSCWGPWSRCEASMKRRRMRRCDNPAPLRGGHACEGPSRQEEPCYISIFERQATCDNDDDFTVGWRDELPPGVQGCLRPPRPDNSFLTKSKQYYDFGEDEEFQCFTGFELEGFQFINCLPDGTWTQPQGRCTRRLCLPPETPDGMTLFPDRDLYRVGQSVGLNCDQAGLAPLPRGFYTCGNSLTWEPPLPGNLRCTDEKPFDPEAGCGPGQKMQNSECVCIQRESCLSQPDSLCVLNTDLNVTVSMSLCSFHAGRCHGDPLFYVGHGVCDSVDPSKVEWAQFRAQVASRSSVQEACDLDTCYEWETCTGQFPTCECKVARDCPRDRQNLFCVALTRSGTQRTLSLNLCSMAALRCSNYQVEILNEGDCPTT